MTLCSQTLTQTLKLLPAKPLAHRMLLICGSGWLLSLAAWSTAMAQTPDGIGAGVPVAPTEPAPALPPTPSLNQDIALPEYIAPAADPAPVGAPAIDYSTVPNAAEASGAGANAGDGFIDRTQYSLGATQRSTPEQQRAVVSPPAINPPDYAISALPEPTMGSGNQPESSIGWTPGSTVAIGREYFNQKILRPLGRLGNGNLRLLFPLAIPAPITSLFGWRTHPITGDQRFHSGTDIGAPLGTPVLAAYTGRVVLADWFGGYGLAIGLEHNKGEQQTLYAHLSEIFVKPGEIVQQGAAIGRVGSTGASTGPHLHFEFRQKTAEGWVAMDAGTQLETALVQLTKSLEVAQAPNIKAAPKRGMKAVL